MNTSDLPANIRRRVKRAMRRLRRLSRRTQKRELRSLAVHHPAFWPVGWKASAAP